MNFRPGAWGKERSVHFHDARCFHNRRFLLALRKARRPLAINVDARELFPVVIIDGYLPMPVFAPAVTAIAAGLAWLLLHDVISPVDWTMASSRRPRK